MQKDGEIKFFAGGFICSLRWSERGLKHLDFAPAVKKNYATAYRCSSCVPDFVIKAMELIKSYFLGLPVDFSLLPVDFGNVGDFTRRVYLQVRMIPYGKTMSYSEVAKKAGNPLAGRAVGLIMKKNPLPLIIPCHRVINKNGSCGGFSLYGGKKMKLRLLEIEGVFIWFFLFFIILYGCCKICPARGKTTCESRNPEKLKVEFVNLCDTGLIASEVNAEIFLNSNISRNKKVARGRGIGKSDNDNIDVLETYLNPASYVIKYRIDLSGKNGKRYEGSKSFTLCNEPLIIEIILYKTQEGCNTRTSVNSPYAFGEICREKSQEEEVKVNKPGC